MDRINIYEEDLTTNGSAQDITDVVYVPGFSVATINQQSIYDNYVPSSNKPNGVPKGFPKLCRTVAEFVHYFGEVYDSTTGKNYETVPAFPDTKDQTYPSGATGFTSNAIPTNPVMFHGGAADPSYIYAKELLYAGIPVLYERVNDAAEDIDIDTMYTALDTKIFNLESSDCKLLDKGEYQFKYLTSGGYPTFEFAGNSIAKKMAALCATRGDCVALIDHTDNAERALVGTTSVYYSANNEYKIPATNSSDTYSSMITPWVDVNLTGKYYDYVSLVLPGSFAYLSTLASSIKSNANWLAIAGVARGIIPNFNSSHVNNILTNSIADSYQIDLGSSESGVSINAITNVKPYGHCIWGNRTLKFKDTSNTKLATAMLNMRNMVSDIKKQVYVAAKSLMFEQNSDILWIRFKALVTPMLDQMKTGQGISNYKLVKVESSDKTKLSCKVIIYPIYAVESFDIYVQLTNEDEVTIK